MVESKSQALPSFQSTTDLVEFFENNDFGEYWSDLPAADFEVEFEKGRRLIPIKNDLMDKLLEIAQLRQVSLEGLIDSFLREKVSFAQAV